MLCAVLLACSNSTLSDRPLSSPASGTLSIYIPPANIDLLGSEPHLIPKQAVLGVRIADDQSLGVGNRVTAIDGVESAPNELDAEVGDLLQVALVYAAARCTDELHEQQNALGRPVECPPRAQARHCRLHLCYLWDVLDGWKEIFFSAVGLQMTWMGEKNLLCSGLAEWSAACQDVFVSCLQY